MESITFGEFIAVAVAFTSLGGAYLTMRKIQKDHQAQRELHEAKILQEAKEADSKIKTILEGKIKALEQALAAFKEGVGKDLDHIRDKQAGEIRVLGEKIEDLRTELRNNHSQMIQMLTKMIEKT